MRVPENNSGHTTWHRHDNIDLCFVNTGTALCTLHETYGFTRDNYK